MRLTPREKTGFELRERLPERMVEQTAQGNLFHKGWMQRITIEPETLGSKDLQPIRGSKRIKGSGRDGTKNEVRKILRS